MSDSTTTRRMLTPQEKLAKAEAEVRAAREAAEAADKKRHGFLVEQRDKATARRDSENAKILGFNTEIGEIEKRTPSVKPQLTAVPRINEAPAGTQDVRSAGS